jgi:Tol biopolymer transport system component
MAAQSTVEDLWVYDLRRDTDTRLTFDGEIKSGEIWTPDNRYIVYGTSQKGMFWVRSDGTGTARQLTKGTALQVPGSFTPDGKTLAFFAGDVTSGTAGTKTSAGFDLWTVRIESDASGIHADDPQLLLATPFMESLPSISPDGKWIAYQSDESGTIQIYIRTFPGMSGRIQLSNAGGQYPKWSRTAHELVFWEPGGHVMFAPYRIQGNSFSVDKPRVWSEKRLTIPSSSGTTFDLAPDGRRVLALIPKETADDQTARNHVIWVANFFDELRRRVPRP